MGYKLKLLLTELPGVPEMIPMGEAAYTYMANVGIDVTSEAVEWSTYRADYYRPGRLHGTLAATRGTYRPRRDHRALLQPQRTHRLLPDFG